MTLLVVFYHKRSGVRVLLKVDIYQHTQRGVAFIAERPSVLRNIPLALPRHCRRPGFRVILNPLTLRVAKTGLTILEIFYLQKHILENMSRGKVHQKPQNNPHSNILRRFPMIPKLFSTVLK